MTDRGNPDGGVIRRDIGHADGRPPRDRRTPRGGRIPPPEGRGAAALRPMIRELVGLGVVAAHDPGGLSERQDLGGRSRRTGAGRRRGAWHARAPVPSPGAAGRGRSRGPAERPPLGPDPLGRLRLGWLKTFADGSLGSRTAALLEPLEPLPGEPPPPNGGYGVWLTPPDELRAQAARAASLGIATQIHGIGDAAVRAALDALAPTVGHAPDAACRAHAAGLDATSRGSPRWASPRRCSRSTSGPTPRRPGGSGDPARRPAGTRLGRSRGPGRHAAGTDAPVEPVDPWPGVACAVTRSAPAWPSGHRRSGPRTRSTSGAPSGPRAWTLRSAPGDGPGPTGAGAPGGHRGAARGGLDEPVEVGGRSGTRGRGSC